MRIVIACWFFLSVTGGIGAIADMDIYQFLSMIDPYAKLSTDQLAGIACSFEKEALPKGTLLIQQGQPVSQVGILLSGMAKVTIVDQFGDEMTCGYLQAEDLIFDVAVLSGMLSPVNVTTQEPTLCLLQTRKGFLDSINDHPQLKNFFYSNAAMGIRRGYDFFCGRYVAGGGSVPGPPQYIRKALAFIDKNYQQQITLEMVAKEIAMSKFHFSRLFKQQMGMSFKRYLNRKRIEISKVLITRENLNVTEACYAVGFNDASYFAKVFRDVEGRSPSKLLSHN